MELIITGGLIGAALGIALYVAEYVLLRRAAAERASKTKRSVELSHDEQRRLASVARFCWTLPPAFALGAWWILG